MRLGKLKKDLLKRFYKCINLNKLLTVLEFDSATPERSNP